MLLHKNSFAFVLLRKLGYSFGPWFPLWIERARVGDDTRNFYTVTLRRPR